ncbi:M48 family metallopeptidase [Vibrio sp. SCSIO 43136]|uniref:M48 family metallopeptidase n=1 Tax=Vibrio sp. SCSIO 43136 TaxID=2819101 RepID=UPI002074BAC1|nr:M48 family metallopeptidase [Vibrio sp. SCSIO 43136]USD66809.1 M48 family metallopeptidase [Vibrio sp. SCSIO 43136]
MDFYQHQDSAKQRTGILVGLFVLAILCITGLIAFITVAIHLSTNTQPIQPEQLIRYGAYSFVGVTLLVGVASGFRLIDLANNGGKSVAEKLGGRLISTNTQDSKHRRLLNVVEEMSIASGMPVPPVYLLSHEKGINAFAAGMSADDAVIGVTQGALDAFNRDELQGVIAHEFSHILNGDMRLNTRLIGGLYGLTCIAHFGYVILDHSSYSLGRTVSRSNSDSNKGAAAILAFSIACIVLGWLGTVFGSLIKAAISRQREFLADASAVQFTRNDQGIAGALKKIGAHTGQSSLESKAASEASHMMFGASKLSSFGGWFATHPPLDERIRRIEPGWDGEFLPVKDGASDALDGISQFSSGQTSTSGVNNTTAELAMTAAETAEVGHGIISQIPKQLQEFAREPYSARFIPLLLMFDGTKEQRIAINNHIPMGMQATYLPWLDHELAPHLRLPLLELAIPALKSLGQSQVQRLIDVLIELAKMDNRYTLSEWAVVSLTEKLLDPHLSATKQFKTLADCEESALWVLRELAWVTHSDEQHAKAAFDLSLKELGWMPQLLEAANSNWQLTRVGLDLLAQLKPKEKKRFLAACLKAVESDGKITVEEGELYRVISVYLEVPAPPLMVD